jgi:3-isopropylmalate/(R)-2-methylmalate dehydratase small subunit
VADAGERGPLSDERAEERRLPTLTGRVWAFADRLAAVDILPARFADLEPTAAAAHLFSDLDPGLAAELQAGDVLVAGRELGGGPGAAPAARALATAGFVATVAASYAPGFAEAALAAGLVPLEVDAPAIFHTGQLLRLKLEAGTVVNLSSGDRQPVRNLTDDLLERLREQIGR